MRVSASATLSRDRNEQDAVVPNVVKSQKDEILPATVTNTKEKGDETVVSTMQERLYEHS